MARPKAGAEPKGKRPEPSVPPRLRKHYQEAVLQKLIEEFGYKNPMQVP